MTIYSCLLDKGFYYFRLLLFIKCSVYTEIFYGVAYYLMGLLILSFNLLIFVKVFIEASFVVYDLSLIFVEIIFLFVFLYIYLFPHLTLTCSQNIIVVFSPFLLFVNYPNKQISLTSYNHTLKSKMLFNFSHSILLPLYNFFCKKAIYSTF